MFRSFLNEKSWLCVVFILSVASCAPQESIERRRNVSLSALDAQAGAPTVINMGVSEFGLYEAITAFTFRIDCDNFTGADSSANTLTLFGPQTGCLAKLRAFVRAGVSFSPKVGSDFASYSVGSSATFVSSAGKVMKVTVASQLPSSLAGGTVSVSYTFSETVGGADVKFGNSIATTSGTLTLGGVAAPALSLVSVAMNAASAVQLEVKLRYSCAKAVTGTSAANYKCGDEIMSSLRFAYKKHDGAAVSEAVLTNLFASSAQISALSPAAAFFVAGSQTDLPNGGVELKVRIPNSVLTSSTDFDGNGVLFALTTDEDSGSFAYAVAKSVVPGVPQKLYIVGVYEGSSNHAAAADVNVTVNSGVPTALAFSSYEAVNWKVSLSAGTTITGVVLYGYKNQTIAGVPASVPTQKNCYEPAASCPNGYVSLYGNNWFYANPSAEATAFTNFVARYITGIAPTSIKVNYTAVSGGYTFP